jgi:hypothetical protein
MVQFIDEIGSSSKMLGAPSEREIDVIQSPCSSSINSSMVWLKRDQKCLRIDFAHLVSSSLESNNDVCTSKLRLRSVKSKALNTYDVASSLGRLDTSNDWSSSLMARSNCTWSIHPEVGVGRLVLWSSRIFWVWRFFNSVFLQEELDIEWWL